MIHVETKGHPYAPGDIVRLFDEGRLHENWTDDVVAAIHRSLEEGGWQRAGNIEVRAKRVESETGWLVTTA